MARKAVIETFGCQMNVHDSERIAGLLEQSGYVMTTDLVEADLVVINTCSVREKAQEKLYARLDDVRGKNNKERPLVAVTGCVAQQEGGKIADQTRTRIDAVVGTQAIKKLPMLLAEAEHSNRLQVDINPYDDVSFPLGIATRHDPTKAFVNIIEGCNDFCAFCVVPYTRGLERMRPSQEILAEVELVAAAGHSEIHLLGQIVNHYQDPQYPDFDFPQLLRSVGEVDKVKRIRFASPHPRHVSDRLIEVMGESEKVCSHLHLPLQSGSSKILKSMNRRHSREYYLQLVNKVRKNIPEIALSTDIIIGFPGETENDFFETLSMTETVRFNSMYSFKYSERPNTLASKRLPDTVASEEKLSRLMRLQDLQKNIQIALNKELVGRRVEVLIDSRSRKRPNELSGRTPQNTIVNFEGAPDQIGDLTIVEIDGSGAHSVHGFQVQSN